MGALATLAPTVFESLVFGHLSHILIDFHKNDVANVVILWQKVMPSTRSLKFLTRTLNFKTKQ